MIFNLLKTIHKWRIDVAGIHQTLVRLLHLLLCMSSHWHYYQSNSYPHDHSSELPSHDLHTNNKTLNQSFEYYTNFVSFTAKETSYFNLYKSHWLWWWHKGVICVGGDQSTQKKTHVAEQVHDLAFPNTTPGTQLRLHWWEFEVSALILH